MRERADFAGRKGNDDDPAQTDMLEHFAPHRPRRMMNRQCSMRSEVQIRRR